jgi:hypothetical protein
MRLSRKVNHSLDLILAKNPADKVSIADISLNESMSLRVRQFLQIFKASSIGQRI